MTDPKPDKPVIEYPCEWSYKVVGTNEDAVRAAVQTSLDTCLTPNSGDREFSLGMSRKSKGGKYLSLGLTITVLDEGERDGVFRTLKDHPDVLMVM